MYIALALLLCQAPDERPAVYQMERGWSCVFFGGTPKYAVHPTEPPRIWENGEWKRLAKSGVDRLAGILPERTEYTQEIPTGVDWDRVHKEGDKFTCSGKECTKSQAIEAMRAVGPNDIEDMTKSLRLTVAHKDPSIRKKFIQETLAGVEKNKSPLVWDCDPDHWSLKCGFQFDDEGGAILQSPTGADLFRQKGLKDTAPLLGALRKADPLYKPLLSSADGIKNYVLIGGAIALFYLLSRKTT